MNTPFNVQQNNNWLIIEDRSLITYYSVAFILNGNQVGAFYKQPVFYLNLANINSGLHELIIMVNSIHHPFFFSILQQQIIYKKNEMVEWNRQPDRSFQAGDILVASDNIGGLPPGYMGHSAIVVDPEHMVEAPGSNITIRKEKITQFLRYHPIHAHYRPVSSELGAKAAHYAVELYKQYKHSIENGTNQLQFSLWTIQALNDPMRYIYCSKLVWLSYFYGANYEFPNDYLWFAPEDLEEVLSEDDQFKLMYKHPEFGFKINV
ncbi:MAG: hypothetical protein WD907_03035 [Bacilli bacterium]